ncbi:MAG TPA: gamma-glutamylcyclotransferase family protein [Pyrinomonadaceae bacterium]|nr:gamma-glutamylcyclotransferase family protein [Pyrinomonadaceae bacterium]
MSLEEEATENLFSYGTLRTEAVQLSTFGRRLEGRPDALVGYSLKMIQVPDEDFVARSGTAHHRNAQFTGVESDTVEGMVFRVTRKELEQADAYEPPEYQRVLARLQSGTSAWVYLDTRR